MGDDGWTCSDIDSCRRGLWAHCCSSLVLLHCDCWVVPLGLSSAILWGSCGSPGGGPSWVPVFWGSLLMSVAQISSVSVSGPGGQVCGSTYSLLHILWRNLIYTSVLTLTPTGV
ncbi:hypothetical protein ILYODFUR_013645 [Ilyodon furcidens]|uniref:Uncharacterized protein n=1 Tax=Ilyodon furcidens TaxID=33524 RepID=A0ABV0SYZ5_9TELE